MCSLSVKLQANQRPVRQVPRVESTPTTVCVTFSSSPLCSLSIILAGFGACLRDIMCLWLRAPVCARVRGRSVSRRHCRVLAIIKPHKGLEPKVQCVFVLPLGACGFPCSAAHTQQNASPHLPLCSPTPSFLFPHAVRLSTCSGVRSASG